MPETIPFSIVIPLYNKEATVERAIRSALNQTVQDFEILVVNDGSTDNGPNVVKAIGDLRIRLIHQENQGVSAARNRGIIEAKHNLIAFLDADDEWLSTFLETIIWLYHKYPTCKVFGTKYYFLAPNGQQRLAIIKGLPAGFTEGIVANYFEIAVRSDPPLWSSAISVDKKAILEIGGFPVGIASGEDLLTWARLAMRYDIAYCNEPRACYHQPVNVTDRPGREPGIPDYVGDALVELLNKMDSTRNPAIRSYISFWYRMRANIFIQFGEGQKAREEIWKAAYYSRMGLRLFVLYAISRLPNNISHKTLSVFKCIKNKMHNHD
jgi:glycosyltransferase involved in cell wall biosynthesis